MNITVVGLNHKTATIELREKFAFSSNEMEQALRRLMTETSSQEAVIISTCNRVEVYTYGASEDAVKQWLYRQGDGLVTPNDFLQHSYILHDIEAVRHLMRVACGVDSLVLGESEILGQVKFSFSQACLYKTVGQHLSRIFRKTFQVAKSIRSSTKIGACPVSVASTAVRFAKESTRDNPRILVIGAGDVGRLVAKYAQSLSVHPLKIMSRHLCNAQRLADEVRGTAISLEKLTEHLSHVDVVISSTSSKVPIINADMVQSIAHHIVMIDLAVPRDISPDVKKYSHVTLCQLDELKSTIQQHVHRRTHAAMQAQRLIEESACDLILSLRTLESDEIIKRYRAHMELHCNNELLKVLKKNAYEDAVALALKDFSRNLLNKIMHLPSMQLRQASVEGRHDVLLSASEIFGIQVGGEQ